MRIIREGWRRNIGFAPRLNMPSLPSKRVAVLKSSASKAGLE